MTTLIRLSEPLPSITCFEEINIGRFRHQSTTKVKQWMETHNWLLIVITSSQDKTRYFKPTMTFFTFLMTYRCMHLVITHLAKIIPMFFGHHWEIQKRKQRLQSFKF